MENDIMNKQRRTDIEAVQRDIGIVKRNLQKIWNCNRHYCSNKENDQKNTFKNKCFNTIKSKST